MISRGSTLKLLKKEIRDIPIISIDTTTFDLTMALHQAQKLGKKIGLLASDQENLTTLHQVSSILQLPFEIYSYSNGNDFYDGPEEKLGYLHQIRDAVLLMNKVPLLYKSRHKGLLVTFRDITKIQEEESKVRREMRTNGLVADITFEDIIYVSKKIESAINKAKKVADSDCTVLIGGESGTGKELIAQSMHNGHSTRKNRPFVVVNCAALDNNLLKSELFGYEDGAFTGARKGGKPGLFEIAHGGTVFLDEIGKIKPDVQSALLRVLQEKKVRRIGSDRLIPVDVRIIAASNENLEDMISKGVFKEDLYYRLTGFKLTLPPLRERREDIQSLVKHMLQKFSSKYHKDIYVLPPLVERKLTMFPWPGNVRQLENLIERCVVIAENEEEAPSVLLDLLEDEFEQCNDTGELRSLAEDEIVVKIGTLVEMETEIIQALARKKGLSKSERALRLGISRPTLIKFMNRVSS